MAARVPWQNGAASMQRILITLFTLTFVAASAAVPVAACISDDTAAGYQQHACCGQQTAAVASAGQCCVVLPLSQDQALTESRTVGAKHDVSALTLASHLPWIQLSTSAEHPSGQSARSAHGVRSVPIYLEQLSLLI